MQTGTTRRSLLGLDRDVENVALAIDEQEGKIGGTKRLGEPLEGSEVRNRLTIEFENEVAGLETGHFGEAAFLNIRHDESGIGG